MNIQVVIDYDRRAKSYAAYCRSFLAARAAATRKGMPLRKSVQRLLSTSSLRPWKPSANRKITFLKV